MSWFFSMPIPLQAFCAACFLYLMTASGAACVFFTKNVNRTALTLLTGGAAGIMIAASFFSLLLPALSYESALPSYVTAVVGFCLGGAFIVLSDLVLSKMQTRFFGLKDKKTALLYFAVTLHNIPEGMAVGVAFAQGMGWGGGTLPALLLALGIGLQNFPEGLCVAIPLRRHGLSPLKSFLFSQGSGLVEIPACLFGVLAAGALISLMPWALAFSAGAMIAVVCSELIPECFEGNKTLASVGIIVGFCLMMTLDLALG